jgi:Ca2+-binding RTX toxin-like protein
MPAPGGHDVLRGGDGNDTYIVKEAGTVIEEVRADGTASDGTDTIEIVGVSFDDTWNTYSLADRVENLNASQSTGSVTLVGNAENNIIVGNADADTLQGHGGDDLLDGGAGAAPDQLEGGIGSDTYVIRNKNDVVVETADGEEDTALVATSEYHLRAGAKVEILKVAPGHTGDVKLTGNAYSTQIVGGLGNDTLDGSRSGIGIQHTLNGGAGNDTYHIVHVGLTNEASDQIEGELVDGNGSTNGTADTVVLYRGLYEEIYGGDQQQVDVAIASAKAYYLSKGIEWVDVKTGYPPPDGSNTPPVLKIAAETRHTPAYDNGSTVFMLRGVDLSDVDNDTLTVTIRFRDIDGQLIDLSNNGQDGGVDASGFRRFTFVGKADEVETWLRSLSFDPAPDLAHDNTVTTRFYIEVTDGDPSHVPVTDEVTVETTKGNDVNVAPVITFAPGTKETPAKDDGLSVFPMRGIDLSDHENDTLTVTISYQDSHGSLILNSGAALVSVSNGIRSYTFTGKADDLDQLLRTLTFDPNPVAASTAVVTEFSITVQDANHAPVTDTVTVTTTDGTDSNTAPVVLGLTDRSTPHDVAVALFGAVDITDPDAADVLTAIVSFAEGSGELFGAGDDWTVTNGIRTYTFAGNADALETFLKGLTFDPSGPNQTTDITLSVQDAYHQATLNHVVVTSTVSNGNTPPTNVRFSELFVSENPLQAAVLGIFHANDLEQDPSSLTFELVEDGTNGGLVIVNNNQLVVTNPTLIDYEKYPTGFFTIKVKAFDGTHFSEVQTIEINIENLFKESVSGTESGDLILGGATGDVLRGLGGNDTLAGSWELDRLFGGDGADSFLFNTTLTSTNHDIIMDFSIVEDRILLNQSVFKGLGAPAASGTPQIIGQAEFGYGTTATDAQQRILYDRATGNIYYDADGDKANGVSARLLATINNKPDSVNKPLLDASMFFVI